MSALLESLLTHEQRTAASKADALAHYSHMAHQAANEAADTSLTWITVQSRILGGTVECGVEIDDPETLHY
ncbi:hypothetical protein M3M33_16475, partial [Loigolactobacillus coryniformis]|uniref:hypothetical protein n=1 Tax=Loigolactobacillus coryniformis TaxID=1610 RepID=UPI00201A3477